MRQKRSGRKFFYFANKNVFCQFCPCLDGEFSSSVSSVLLPAYSDRELLPSSLTLSVISSLSLLDWRMKFGGHDWGWRRQEDCDE